MHNVTHLHLDPNNISSVNVFEIPQSLFTFSFHILKRSTGHALVI